MNNNAEYFDKLLFTELRLAAVETSEAPVGDAERGASFAGLYAVP